MHSEPGSFHLLAKIRLALFEKRLHAFFRFLGLVIQAERLEAETADATHGLRRRVERALRNRDTVSM